ncbi:hypothetical protein SNE40_006086 [Patella caerulea]|uniref:Uncharacterized protein n=1 Tax=Patella caerulea TaxID=87958 RepID=A0AAN8K2K9_PATCE
MNVKTFENIRLLLQSLRSHTTLSSDISEFIEQITCNSTSKSCMTQSCLECEEAVENYAPTNPHTTLEYRQWRNGERTEIEELKGTVGEAFAELKQQLKGFLLHTYIKRCQSQHLEYLISNSNDQRIVLQVDFSENATILSQNEVQSAHWHHHQATLFTAYAWINGKDKSNRSIVLISDCLQHTKYSVYMYMDYIFCFLKEIHPTLKHIDIFSDGTGSQFKQRYLFSNLYSWQQKHELQLTWNFFCNIPRKGRGGRVRWHCETFCLALY